eukprot:gnl/MRDRNA2_/MRDRNA2_120029_c0_seq1.p1 gnl/MRDRNA2_/MRDRNA2_120029_c0~~gnl/MRDRNA2_/MRDRNA2_120029_c0_seq1.p1  ORF type:complete len:105 (+),score=6.70 gnl/MRDRNA2_/MRDRNA2_120029_c0_seq1:111-425(+)
MQKASPSTTFHEVIHPCYNLCFVANYFEVWKLFSSFTLYSGFDLLHDLSHLLIRGVFISSSTTNHGLRLEDEFGNVLTPQEEDIDQGKNQEINHFVLRDTISLA